MRRDITLLLKFLYCTSQMCRVRGAGGTQTSKNWWLSPQSIQEKGAKGGWGILQTWPSAPCRLYTQQAGRTERKKPTLHCETAAGENPKNRNVLIAKKSKFHKTRAKCNCSRCIRTAQPMLPPSHSHIWQLCLAPLYIYLFGWPISWQPSRSGVPVLVFCFYIWSRERGNAVFGRYAVNSPWCLVGNL